MHNDLARAIKALEQKKSHAFVWRQNFRSSSVLFPRQTTPTDDEKSSQLFLCWPGLFHTAAFVVVIVCVFCLVFLVGLFVCFVCLLLGCFFDFFGIVMTPMGLVLGPPLAQFFLVHLYIKMAEVSPRFSW